MDIHQAKSVAEIQAILSSLQRREASVTSRLNALVASQKDLSRELGRLDLSRAQLGAQVVNTRSISNGMLAAAASTASRISSAVTRLDQEQANVKATLAVVDQVAELKACVLGVNGSMGAPQDWEMAATYLHRAAKIPADVVDGAFAEEIVPTAEVPDAPRVTLDAAAASLCALFLREFEKAAAEGDGARITRFFKLFPLIGRTEVGLNAYGRYVCQGVAARARQNMGAGVQKKDGFFYASTLTKLFEHIAQIVDGHEPLVERHYGVGMMVTVIERLQVEADVQGGIILDTWSEERVIDRKLTDIKSYAYSFLVQSFLPTQRPSMGPPRSGSPAIKDGAVAGRSSEDEGVDMKEVDQLLSESAVMMGRWALYARFLASKSPEQGESEEETVLKMPDFLITSHLHKKVINILIDPFNAMTTFFFRRSVEKAFQLDEPPQDLSLSLQRPLPGNAPFITSAVDDVMYIVNQVIQRSLSTSQRSVIANVIPTLARVLGSDFVGVTTRKMRDECYPKAAIAGALPPEDKIIAFILQINNLEVSIDYIKRIISSHLASHPSNADSPPQEGAQIHTQFPFGNDATFVIQQLKSLESSFTTKCHDLLTDGLNVLFHQVIKPRIRPILLETFRDVAYDPPSAPHPTSPPAASSSPTEDDPAHQVRERFTRAYTALLRPLLRLLPSTATTPGSPTDRLLSLTTEYLATALEKRVWGLHGRVTPLGAVGLERDVGAIVAEATRGGRYGLRDGFARLGQLVMVVGMDEEEWGEVGEEGGVEWVLDGEERRRARGIVRR
ncbi:COG4-domain-containing protein [Eremomyces bilateralis CBS 781.70]|uniref:Conserved oligomeric Golgi complex subunit 4 n=1 Tax=Eremomyces bilateralis CBS 781.70 TaxID=1392243 RepID=A0A6G1FZ31_9PEZI|nr:COG4-domain-containing protein [Eremomyces bilateralis CBS 781.70]KAF1810819.1 COG4-domain-containing protein [Eremomyces bilateralis CBS 781.70]